MSVKMRDVPYEVQRDLLTAISEASPDSKCYYKRCFIRTWEDYGVDEAVRQWLLSPFPDPKSGKIHDVLALIAEAKSAVYTPTRR